MWGLDLGTTNTTLGRWDAERDRPQLVSLTGVERPIDDPERAAPPRGLIPSATQLIESPGAWARFASSGPFARRLLSGRLAYIGQQALDRSDPSRPRGFVPAFKGALGREPLRPLAQSGGRAHSARDIAWHFVRELLGEVKRQTGERIRELAVATPVGSYESYRAEVAGVLKRLGVERVRFLDEPVAAAIGYSLSMGMQRRVLVVDFGGGTLDLALVELAAAPDDAGCRVVAKAGRPLGGNLVDGWLLEHFCSRLGYQLGEPEDDDARFWQELMLREARRVKEALERSPTATFGLYPPEELRRFEARLAGESHELSVTRQEVIDLLSERGLYRALDECRIEVLSAAAREHVDSIDDVLLVGGSTLLPEVFASCARAFGRDRVRYWLPFEAVAYGATLFAAGRVRTSDFILHDYALLTHDAKTGHPSHTVIIPRGTRFPTAMNLWERQLVPTCALGEPERFFKLVICEVGDGSSERAFGWDDAGNLHRLGGSAMPELQPLVVKLNEANPALGELEPPHSPSDRRPRLRVAFGVNAERWLCATVEDLLAKRRLMNEEPVVRLL
ncbi:MAG TPA: Hsp70 family protein [Polyangiaceae bacterium]|nr:Hsp70 family protein [Polyangiaceae bacterium]